MGMLFPGVVAAAVLMAAVQQGESLGVSNRKLCQDADCTVAISDAVALSEYDHGSVDSRFLSFPKGANVVVYSKSAGSRLDLWSGEYDGKKGFFSKSYVKETTVHHSEPSFMVPVEDEVEVEEDEAADDGVDLYDVEAAAEEVVAAASSVHAHSDKADDGVVVSPADELKEPSAAEPGASRLPSAADETSYVAFSSDAQQPLPAVAASAGVNGSISTPDVQQPVLPPAAAAGNDPVRGAAAAVQVSNDTVAPASAAAEASERDGQSGTRSDDGEQHLRLHPTPVVNSSTSTTVPGLPSQASKLPSSVDQLEPKSSDGVDNGGGDLELPADVANGDLRPESPVAVAADNHSSHATTPPAAGGGGARGGTVSPNTDAAKSADVADRAELESSGGAFTAGQADASAESNRTGVDVGNVSTPGDSLSADGSETVNATARVDSPATDGNETLNATAQGNLPLSTGSQAGAVEPGSEPHHGSELPAVDDAKHADLPHKIASSQLDGVVPHRLPDGRGSGTDRHHDAAHRGLHDRLHAADKLLSRAARQQQQEQVKRSEAGVGEERLLPTDEPGLRSSGDAEEQNETLGGGGTLSTLLPLPVQLSPPDRLGQSDGESEATSKRPGQSVKSGAEGVGEAGVTLTTSSASGVEGAAGGNQSIDDSSSGSSTGAGNASAEASVLIEGATEQQHVSSVQRSATLVPQPDAEPSFVQTTTKPTASHSAGDISVPAAEVIAIDYDSVLSGFERSPPTSYVEQLELQLWRVASGLPPFVQQVMQVRPLGLEPPMFLLANLMSLWLILCSAFAVCFSGCCDNRAKAKIADARCAELYKQLNVAEVEVKELQAALQEAERRTTEEARDRQADHETRVGALEDQIKTLQEQAESESQRWSSLAADGEDKLRQATAELDSSRALVTQWQAYAQDLDAKLKAALTLGPDLEARCVEAELLVQSHREKTVALETTVVRLEDEVLLLKQERDHLNAEAADRDEKARELEARLQAQDAERSELRAAVAACELKTASLRESYQLLLLAGGDVGDAAGDSGSPALETAAADEAESEESRESERKESADATCGGDPAATDGGVSSGENEGAGSGGSLAAPTVDRAAFARRRQTTKVVEQHLRQLEEAAKARQELEDLREQSVSQKEQLQLARASLLELEDLSRKHLAEKSDLVSEISVLKRAKDEADMSLKVLTAYFKEKEAELQRTLGEREHSSRTSGASVIELQQMCSQLQAERDQLRQEVRDVRDEMRASEKDLRKRLLENEKKAYDAWVLQRNKERELAAQQTECSQLRQKLLDAELARTKQNESLSELRLQLELEKAKCQEANAALAAANAAAATTSAAVAATTGDSANESGLSLESGGVGPRPAAGSQRPTSRSSTTAAASMSQRLPLLPPPPPVLPPLPLLPPLRPPLPPPFAMAPSMGLPPPGIVPMMPPMPNMLRDRRSMSPTVGERALPRHMLTPPVDGPMGGVPQHLPQPPPMLPPAMAFDPRLRPAYGGVQDPRDGAGQLPPMHPHHAAMPPRGVPLTFDGMAGAPPLLPPPHGMRGPMGPQGVPHLRPPHLAAAFDPRVDGFGGGGAARPPLGSVDPGRQFVPVEAPPFQGRDPTLLPAASSPLQRYAAASGHEFAGAAAAGHGHRQPESPMNLSAISNDARNASQSSEPGSGRNAGYGVPPTGYGAPPTGGRV